MMVPFAALIAFAAWMCYFSSTLYYSFVKRDVILKPGQNHTIVDEIPKIATESHGVGFWSWQLDNYCYSYCYYDACPNFDTKYESAKVSLYF